MADFKDFSEKHSIEEEEKKKNEKAEHSKEPGNRANERGMPSERDEDEM